jgi:hypothetical protein
VDQIPIQDSAIENRKSKLLCVVRKRREETLVSKWVQLWTIKGRKAFSGSFFRIL